MRKFFIFVLTISSIFATQVEITSNKFSADEKRWTSEFNGNVLIIKEQDRLNADKVVINFDEKKQPLKYSALGSVRIKIFLNDKYYNASGNTLVYEPDIKKYILEGGAFLEETDTNKRVYGEKIVINQANGTYDVEGNGSKPVKFIFQIEDKK